LWLRELVMTYVLPADDMSKGLEANCLGFVEDYLLIRSCQLQMVGAGVLLVTVQV
jgi:hypothetical protein